MSSARPTPEFSAAPTVVIGVGAGIAAFKVAHVVRGLRRFGYQTHVIPTESSLQFVGLQTWQELSENPVGVTVFHGADRPGHIELARRADLFIVAPCTADLGARLRAGIADDLLTATFLASEAPKLLVPAMHTGMWRNPATIENFRVLADRGIRVLPPTTGPLSSGDSGEGRMPEPDAIVEAAERLLRPLLRGDGPLIGKRVLISAGGTVENIDPVRYLSNYSSGRQGVELAKAAVAAGADVTLLAAKCEVELPRHPHIEIVRTLSAAEMQREVQRRLPDTDILIMAAAVADYRPESISGAKLKKSSWGESPLLRLTPNPDILRGACESPDRPSLVVGFGAETGQPEQVLALGQEKARRKGVDFLAINRVGDGLGFGEVDNELMVVDSKGQLRARLQGSKSLLAKELLKLVVDQAR